MIGGRQASCEPGRGSDAAQTFEVRAFRDALGRFATGIVIVTAKLADGELSGMTANSFSSVSIDPPLVLFSVQRTTKSGVALLRAKGYGISILRSDQQHLSNQFARVSSDRWHSTEWVEGYAGAPFIRGAFARFECAPYATYDGGDHVIVVVRVLKFAIEPARLDPLLFFSGRHRKLSAEDGQPGPQDWPLSIYGGL